jgi:hypothetical protein
MGIVTELIVPRRARSRDLATDAAGAFVALGRSGDGDRVVRCRDRSTVYIG